MKMRIKRQKAMQIANALKATGKFTFGDAQRKAWEVVRCIDDMQKTEVVLRFLTVNESEEIPQQRTATLSTDLFNWVSTSTKPAAKPNPLQIKYWDTNKGGWRSFNAANFVSHKSNI